MSFDYNKSVWGSDTASLDYGHPTAFRLRAALSIVSALPKDIKILEVGCGGGQFIRAIKKLNPESQCFGFDVSEQAINLARQFNDGVKYDWGEAQNWPYEENQFDAVLIFDVLEHVDNVEQTLREIKRVLKPNGVFYAFVPCEGDKLSFWYHLRYFKTLDNLTNKYAGHINRFSRNKWLNIFKEFNFVRDRFLYSEHFLGQLVGVVSFILMDRMAKQKKLSQLNNETYYKSLAKETKFKKLFSILRWFGNFLIYWESWILKNIPSSNVHFFLKNIK